MILRDGIFGEGTPAVAVDFDDIICVVRQAAELQADLAMFHCQDRILGPGIHMKFTIALKRTERQPNAARVEKESLSAAPYLLSMRMPACQDVFIERTEKFLKLVFGRGWKNDIVKVCGGTMKT